VAVVRGRRAARPSCNQVSSYRFRRARDRQEIEIEVEAVDPGSKGRSIRVSKHSSVEVELPDKRLAAVLAQKLADQTGFTVVVTDEDGDLVCVAQRQPKRREVR